MASFGGWLQGLLNFQVGSPGAATEADAAKAAAAAEAAAAAIADAPAVANAVKKLGVDSLTNSWVELRKEPSAYARACNHF